MKFNSQICTTREQSERLIALGLKKETADMGIYYSELYGVDRVFANDVFDEAPSFDCDDIPAWSLHRLMRLVFNSGGVIVPIFQEDDAYEILIYEIKGRIKEGYFNEDYMKEAL